MGSGSRCAIRDMTPYEQRRENDFVGLRWLHQFGWLRTTELGPLIWPTNATARHQADRLVRSWLERELVLVRMLPEGAGRALVLAIRGVRMLAEHGYVATSGKDVGETSGHEWRPPTTWRHDLLAAGVLVDLHKRGWEVFPEAHVRRHSSKNTKLPDGLARKGADVIWLEVESARKTGPSMRHLANALCVVASGGAATLIGMKPTLAMVAYRADAKDERGHSLSHRNRVRAAVAAEAKSAVELIWAECHVKGTAGVNAATYKEDRVESDLSSAILKRLNAVGWRDEDGCLVSSYGARRAYVWFDDTAAQWSHRIDDEPAQYSGTVSEAKRDCANYLARESGDGNAHGKRVE